MHNEPNSQFLRIKMTNLDDIMPQGLLFTDNNNTYHLWFIILWNANGLNGITRQLRKPKKNSRHILKIKKKSFNYNLFLFVYWRGFGK